MLKHIAFFFLTLIGFTSINAQIIENEYIIDIKEGETEAFIQDLQKNTDLNQRLPSNYKVLVEDFDLIHVANQGDREVFEKWLEGNDLIENWYHDAYTSKRADPNDYYFGGQYNLELIDAIKAWDITTGGITADGHQIVVAVMDDGFEYEHVDLIENIFFNTDEIENDGIDNDDNGYIDDYVGWNTTNENDNHPIVDAHGIAVSGVIGAQTDNTEGISGLVWDVKILPISGIKKNSETIAGYEYAYQMRKQYNDSNGAKGAYIVATNYSAGIDRAFGEDPQYKDWCDMYDRLAEVGILSVAATTNKNVNVDEDGDMPTTCSSPYLISVTNVDRNDSKFPGAGYGSTHIDLGAPGQELINLDLGNNYSQMLQGTSLATPQVAAVVALCYSVPCPSLYQNSLDDPIKMVEKVRNAILNGVDANSTLNNITVTGGRLNAYNSVKAMDDSCESENTEVINITDIQNIDGSNFEVYYTTQTIEPLNLMVTDRVGRVILRQKFTPEIIGEETLMVNLNGQPTGIYIFSIYNDDSINSKKHFILE